MYYLLFVWTWRLTNPEAMDNTNKRFRNLVKKFYVKLYLQNKNRDVSSDSSTHKKVTTIRDATRSWHSLSPNDKEVFIEQFKKQGSSHKARIATYLKTASPTQIKKICESQVKYVLNINEADDHSNKTIEGITNLDVSENLESISEYSNQISSFEISDGGGVHNGENTTDYKVPDITQIWHKPVIPLPEPPTALNAHQLFDLINNKNSEDYRPWDSITNTDKKRYQEAVLKLKKEYLKKYELCLQNLTSEELYHHMIDVLSNTLS